MPRPRSNRRSVWPAVVQVGLASLLLLFPVVYVLSVGPVGWLANRGLVDGEVALALYEPLFWAADKSRMTDRALWSYLDAWGAVRVVE